MYLLWVMLPEINVSYRIVSLSRNLNRFTYIIHFCAYRPWHEKVKLFASKLTIN